MPTFKPRKKRARDYAVRASPHAGQWLEEGQPGHEVASPLSPSVDAFDDSTGIANLFSFSR